MTLPELSSAGPSRVRLDRWLWAARFFPTRAKAKAAVEGGKVSLAPGGVGAFSKPKVSREIGVGDLLEVQRGSLVQQVTVTGLSDRRGNAAAAAQLYQETADSIEAREAVRARRQMERAGLQVPQQRPSKRDRRALMKLKHPHDDPEVS
ncbi:MAG: S4 domain-containing protein [Pseudomonadales bacterium]